MRKNEYNSLEEFTSQYIGEWSPSDGHWLGLDFKYNGKEYRLSTGAMFNDSESDCMFYLYYNNENTYELLGAYKNMDDLLDSKVIEQTAFASIIMNDDTELLGQD